MGHPARFGLFARVGTALLATLWVAGLDSCGDATGPNGTGSRLQLDQPVTGRVSGDTVRAYAFQAAAGGEYHVQLQALEGGLELVIRDSASQQPVNQLWADAAQQPVTSTIVTSRNGGVYELRVRSIPAGSGPVRFLLGVSERSTEPELQAAAFALGDTVSGETMASAGDVDQFFLTATAGDEIVVVAEGLPGATGAMRLRFFDAAAGSELPLWYWVGGGGPALLTTGPVQVPATGRLWLRFQSVQGDPPFGGAYRFWTYAVDRAPEHLPTALSFSTVLTDRIDRSGDVDEFTFEAAAGAEYSAFLTSPRTFRLEFAPRGGTPIVAVYDTLASDTSLFTATTELFQVTQAGTWVARVTGPEAIADTGAYRIYVLPIDRRPEHAAQALVVGDTVEGEAIDLPGDVDEFTFAATAGEEYNAFLEVTDREPTARLQLEAVDADSTVLGTAYSNELDTTLLDQPVGRFAVRRTGTQRLRVSGLHLGSFSSGRGAYRLFLKRVLRTPETAPAALAPGDSVSTEELDLPGDLDEFQFTVPDTTGVVLVAELLPGQPGGGGLLVQLRDGGSVRLEAALFGGTVAAGPVTLAPGVHTLRVGAGYHDPNATQRGRYKLWTYGSHPAPEAVGATISIGDTVNGERIGTPGDRDVYVLQGTRGEHVNLLLQGLAPSTGTPFGASLQGPAGFGDAPIALVEARQSTAALADHQTMRFELPVTGEYRLTLAASVDPDPARSTGDYRFAIVHADTAPEHAPALLAPGDSVTTEAVDVPGDLDAFTVAGTPGQVLNLIFSANGGPTWVPRLFAIDPSTGDSLGSAVGQGTQLSGPLAIPTGGSVRIEVHEPVFSGFRYCTDATCGGVYHFTGPYAFRVVAVDRRPESVPAAIAVGDTVRGEAVLPSGDLDEFMSSGTPGEPMSSYIRLLAPPQPAGTMIALEVVDPGTGALLVGHMAVTGPTTGFVRAGGFTVPAGGSILVRVRGGLLGYDPGTAPYEFFVMRGT